MANPARPISHLRHSLRSPPSLRGALSLPTHQDVRKVFGRAREIKEVRMMTDTKTRRNKGFRFMRYVDTAQAKKAVTELAEVHAKHCGVAAFEGNDTIFLGNIDKK